MILRELQVLRWCGLDERTWALHPESNLLVGANEAGKTRLTRAIWYALLERSAGRSRTRLALRDRRAPDADDPRVRLTFERAGATWTVDKAFAGSTCRTRLERIDGHAEYLEGPSAEARLAELLGYEPASGNKDRWDSLVGLRLWPLLFVRERAGHLPPAGEDAAGPESAAFVQDLLRGEAGAATLSPRGAAVFAALEHVLLEHVTAGGKPRASGPLKAAEARWSAARDELAEVDAAARDVADSLARLSRLGHDLDQARAEREALRAQLTDTRARLAEIQTLDVARDRAQRALEAAERDLAERRREQDAQAQLASELARTRAEIQAAQEDLESERATLAKTEQARDDARDRADTDRARLRQAQDRRDRLSQRLRSRRAAVELARAREHLTRATELAKAIADLQARLDAAAEITPAWLAKLEALDDAARLARLQVASAAVRLRLKATRDLSVDGSDLPGGGELDLEITEARTLRIADEHGPAMALVVRPGGEELRHLQEAADRAGAELRGALDQAGLPDLARARARLRDIESASRELRGLRARLDDALTQADCDDLEALRTRVAELAARASAETPGEPDAAGHPNAAAGPGASPAGADAAPSGDLDDLQRALEEAEAHVRSCEQALERRQAMVDAATDLAHERAQSCAALQARVEALGPRVAELTQALDAQPGKDALTEAVARATRAVAQARDEHDELQGRWERAGGQTLAGQVAGLERDLSHATDRLHELELEHARLRARVQEQTQGRDLERARATARATALTARRELLAVRTRARALALLVEEIRTRRERAQQRMLAPLIQEAAPDVRTILGGARLALDEHLHPTLLRDDVHLPHQVLSAGAQEQLALALRLGLLRILRRALDEPLPLILDDPLTHTDPERMAPVRDMLRRAAAAGLQLILLTCDPTPYRGLGFANTIHL